jgi:Family of unknown function (DUF5670)
VKAAVLAYETPGRRGDLAHDAPRERVLTLRAPRTAGLHCGITGTEEVAMLWTIFVILLVLWLLGVVTSYTLGGFIHVLLVIAIIMAVMQLIQGRRAL